MGDLSTAEAYDRLLELLRNNDLQWVAAQVQEQVRAGKPVLKKVAPRRADITPIFLDEADPQQKSPSRRRERFAATEEYSPDERLNLAVAAIEAAVVHTAEMEDALAGFASTQGIGANQIVLAPDEFDDAARISIGTLANDRRASIGDLKSALSDIRIALAANGHT